jgi:hypothetical protein
VAAQARLSLGLGDARTARMIGDTLPTIEDGWDFADFALVPLLWGRTRWGGLMPDDLRARVDRWSFRPSPGCVSAPATSARGSTRCRGRRWPSATTG